MRHLVMVGNKNDLPQPSSRVSTSSRENKIIPPLHAALLHPQNPSLPAGTSRPSCALLHCTPSKPNTPTPYIPYTNRRLPLNPKPPSYIRKSHLSNVFSNLQGSHKHISDRTPATFWDSTKSTLNLASRKPPSPPFPNTDSKPGLVDTVPFETCDKSIGGWK